LKDSPFDGDETEQKNFKWVDRFIFGSRPGWFRNRAKRFGFGNKADMNVTPL